MNCTRSILSFVLCLVVCTAYGQDARYSFSAPVDMKKEGWNKVLCMKNGNTMLFHFEHEKPVVVKVFDSLHKEIASQKHLCRFLDIYMIQDAVFKGLFEVNGEAVLFIEQEHLSKYQLLRLRFSGNDGMLVEEKLVMESKSLTKRTNYYVMKNNQDDSYSILFCTDNPSFKECKANVTFYNNRHEATRDVSLDMDRKKYDLANVVSAQSQPNGICISICLSKQVENGTSPLANMGAIEVYDHVLQLYYIPKDSSVVRSTTMDVTKDVYPYYANYTYNPFAKSLNVLLLGYAETYYKFGLGQRPGAIVDHVLIKLDEQDMRPGFKWMKNRMATAWLRERTDSTKMYDGLPVQMTTNENGLSTIVSQSFTRYGEPETQTRYNMNSYFGNVGITQFDDDGNEIWGTVLPISQCFKSYKRYYVASELSQRSQSQLMFSDLPEQVYQRQFASLNSYSFARNFYIIYNDENRNFNNSIEKPGDTIYNFRNTNACYYKLNRKREISKHYLYGQPANDEYKCSFIEGADFDDKNGVYVSLVQYKKGDDITLRMAWSHLE